ncbi:MAG: type II secretion system protein GspK, partial [Candidatus Omnitrophica bacterium]|nr:type II secretion system protein GspK [Candidatus Omnitrophota bacterium]
AKAQERYGKIKNLVTTYGPEKININTALKQILTIISRAAAAEVGESVDKNMAVSLAQAIVDKREQAPLTSENISNISALFGEELTPEEYIIFNSMLTYLAPDSSYFQINAAGRANEVSKNITVVYDREHKKIVYWHEN